MKTTFQVTYNIANPADLTIDQEYKNIVNQGSYFYYELLPGSSEDFAFLKALTIKVKSIIGDADLVVSVTDK